MAEGNKRREGDSPDLFSLLRFLLGSFACASLIRHVVHGDNCFWLE